MNRNYDVSRIKRIGITSFKAPPNSVSGAEDVFSRFMLENGFSVIERSRIEEILKENKLSAQGVLSAGTGKDIGHLLGVDALLVGEITDYTPEKTDIAYVQTNNHYADPVYSNHMERGPDGSYRNVMRQSGEKITNEQVTTPTVYTEYAQIGLAVRLVDVETGEIIWAASDTGEGDSALDAVESSAEYLSKRLRKDWNAALASPPVAQKQP
jgi:hypothetical protein